MEKVTLASVHRSVKKRAELRSDAAKPHGKYFSFFGMDQRVQEVRALRRTWATDAQVVERQKASSRESHPPIRMADQELSRGNEVHGAFGA